MMPNEEENRALMMRLLSPVIFPAGNDLLAFGRDLMSHAPKTPITRLSYGVLRTISGIVAQATMQFRSLFHVAEHAYDHVAATIARGIFESVLAERFILTMPARVSGPPMPAGVSVRDWHAMLYVDYPIYKNCINNRKAEASNLFPVITPQMKQKNEAKIAEFETRLGSDWVKVFKNGYSGMSIENLSERCGLQQWHLAIYSRLSLTTHSNRGIDYTSDGAVEGEVLVQMAGRIGPTLSAIEFSTLLYRTLLHDVSTELKLRFPERVDELVAAIAGEINRIEAVAAQGGAS